MHSRLTLLSAAIVLCAACTGGRHNAYHLLPVDYSRSMEALYRSKAIDSAMVIGADLRLDFANLTGKRAQGPQDDPDYATYGDCSVEYKLGGLDASGYNRIHFKVKPECEGLNVVALNLSLDNQFSHLVNLGNMTENDCYLELGEYDLSHLDKMVFTASVKGKDNAHAADSSHYHIYDIRLEHVQLEKTAGWEPMDGRIILSSAGYMSGYGKSALVSATSCAQGDIFHLLQNGESVYSGTLERVSSSVGEFGVMDFSDFDREGVYQIRLGDITSPAFPIGSDCWDGARQKLLNYIFAQRCGYDVPGIHDKCHTDLFADHNGRSISYGGGWHDAGDLSQQTLQTGDVAFALTEASLNCKDRKMAARLQEEAQWGYEFILHCRFGDGYRASSMGLKHWTDSKEGTYDDIHTVRTQNNSFDNFLYAAYEAYGARMIKDRKLGKRLADAAVEDFNFAREKFRKNGFEAFPHIMEHCYNTSQSQFMATASWAASQLYLLTGQEEYASYAVECMDYVLCCQQTENVNGGHQGFFYRSPSKQVPVHFIHQSREQIYAQALALICQTQPGHVKKGKWEEALGLYGAYIKSMMAYTYPYGMIPSGIYCEREYEDSQSFYSLHIFAPADASERFDAQLEQGVDLGDGFHLRRFPIWFSIFNGNGAIHLSSGKAAAICGNYFKDKELLQIGQQQLQWVAGMNPFGQSLIFGEGFNYPQMDSFSSGEICGETPVGIRSYQDSDIPYWPAVNNACYKEVWVTNAGKLLSLISEY